MWLRLPQATCTGFETCPVFPKWGKCQMGPRILPWSVFCLIFSRWTVIEAGLTPNASQNSTHLILTILVFLMKTNQIYRWLNFKMILKEEAARGQFNPSACSVRPQCSKHREISLISHQRGSECGQMPAAPCLRCPMGADMRDREVFATNAVCRCSSTVPPLLSPFPQEALDLEGQKNRTA